MMIRAASVALLAALLGGCATVPAGTYFPHPGDAATARIAHTLYRAAKAAGDDPDRYSFAFIKSRTATAYSDEDAVFYVTDGMAGMPQPVLDAVIAHEVAHEVLGHIGTRRKLSLSLTAGFAVLGGFAPGAGLLDFVVNPLVIRSFSRKQELDADRKAVDILQVMGYQAPRRALADALTAVAAHTPKPKEEPGGLLATHPEIEERLAALEPLEPTPPVARAVPK
ncbi:MAG TPA: M48 family metalloprotease [Methylomirabilota bacterium]|nr:M48 family metalloprotease [Methylomirabilota bacterium]